MNANRAEAERGGQKSIAMASKRSSWMTPDGASGLDDLEKSSLSSSLSSRCSTHEDLMQAANDVEELIARSNGPVHSKETVKISRSANSTTLTKDSTVQTTLPGGRTKVTAKALESYSIVSEPAAKAKETSSDGRPLNFGAAFPGVYRSSYPNSSNFGFLQALKLKTVISLSQKDDENDKEVKKFYAEKGIRHINFHMKGTKKEAIPLDTMVSILVTILNPQNQPLLVHCNHGKHRTGCVIAVARLLHGWQPEKAVDEYKSYATPKIRDCDVDYIRTFDMGSVRHLSCCTTLDSMTYGGVLRSPVSPAQNEAFTRTVVFSFCVLSLWVWTMCNLVGKDTSGPL